MENKKEPKKRKFKELHLQIIIVLAAFFLMTVSSYFFSRNAERRHLEEQIEETFFSIESLLNAELKEYYTILGTVSETIRGMFMRGFELDIIKAYMVDMNTYGLNIENAAGFYALFAGFGEDGLNGFNASVPDADFDAMIAAGYNPKERPWYIAAENSGSNIAVTDPYVDEVQGTKEVTFTFVRNIFDEDGKRLGIICLDVLLDRIYKLSMEHRDSEITFWTLHDQNHTVIAHPNPEFIGMPFRDIDSSLAEAAEELEQEGVVSHLFSRDYLGKPAFFSMRPLDNGWYIGIVTYTDNYYMYLNNTLWFLILLATLLSSFLIFILININEAKEKSDKLVLEAEEEKIALTNLNRILNGLSAMIIVTDPETDEILFINDSMRKVFGVPEDYYGLICYKVLWKENERCPFCPCRKLALEPKTEVDWEQNHELTGKIYLSHSKYIKWPNGKNVHIQHSIDKTDMQAAIDALKEAESQIAEKNEQLQTALIKAEAASKAKSAFLANMSHEIRTPMNAILGITEIQLRDENLTAEMEEGLEKIYDSGNMLLNIINDILDLSKIEAGRLEIIPIKYDIPSLINDTVQINRLRYDYKPIEFTLDVDENTPLYLIGDELRLKQILGNILSNAFKYTDKGKIQMSISHEDSHPAAHNNNVTLIISISDTGQGMTPEQLDRLFEDYTRFNLDLNRTTVGTGLGMSITKRLVDLMDGEIFVESEAGVGSTFTVKLPQKRVNRHICGKDTAEKLRNFRFQSTSMSRKSRMLREYMPYGSVLVVDDVESNIYVIRGMLLPYGLKIDTAGGGSEAIEKIRAGNVYDIIFMDHMMPKMDGIEAVKILRGMGYTNCIVALTANALVGQAEIFFKNGFDGYISKPIDSRELNQILNEFIRNRKPPDIVKAARRLHQSANITGAGEKTAKKSEVEHFFVLDAVSAVKVLEGIQDFKADLDSYEITVHGIKSALGNIGENELSEAALRLEKAAINREFTVMAEGTPVLIGALKKLIEKFSKTQEQDYEQEDESESDESKSYPETEDAAFLCEKLLAIKKACEEFDTKAVLEALDALKRKKWPMEIDEVIDEINVHILHSAFKKAIKTAEETARIINSQIENGNTTL